MVYFPTLSNQTNRDKLNGLGQPQQCRSQSGIVQQQRSHNQSNQRDVTHSRDSNEGLKDTIPQKLVSFFIIHQWDRDVADGDHRPQPVYEKEGC
jgi:hypothetical protein